MRVSIANIRTFPFVAEREAAGKLTLRGAYFAIRDGVHWVMDDTGGFNPVIGGAATGVSPSGEHTPRSNRKLVSHCTCPAAPQLITPAVIPRPPPRLSTDNNQSAHPSQHP